MTILILAPHTDDAEFGCGGTIARHVEEGHEVHVIAFSACGLPQLEAEFEAGCAALGAGHILLEMQVRNFHQQRQGILDAMLHYRHAFQPDRVYLPHPELDMHQDHHVIGREGLRAFKHTTVLAYEVPWNNPTWNTRHFTRLTEEHVSAKVTAIRCYQSQAHRPYASEEAVRAQVRMRGTQCGTTYAECFDVIRWIN